ncbi:MAG: folate-binding protein YgfZ [Nitratireductor sp.]|nr:folate-binding protein YgfZ [Nitratireductor sp.]
MDGATGAATLEGRAIVAVNGPDAVHFLQNLVTCDVEALADGEAAFGALLTPQGKILFDFFLLRTSDGFLADADAALADDFVKRLGFYKLRAKVTVERADPALRVHAIWGGRPADLPGRLVEDPRLPEMGFRLYGEAGPELAAGDYHAHRIGLGMPQGGLDYAYGDAFPHEALMDQFGGVDFRKGCYVGQEVVSRMQHRGTARSRVVMVSGERLPERGTEISAGGKACGAMGSSSGGKGLAMLRLDRVKEALDAGGAVMAGDCPIGVEIQPWANFGWPQTGS